MTPSMQALVLFAGWTLLLVLIVFAYRGLRLVTGTAITSWPRGSRNPNDPGFINRVADAHANALENLPVFAVLVLAAAASGKAGAIDAIAPIAFYARVGQSVSHLIGVNTVLVLARATFWAIQLVVFGLILARLVA